VRRFSPDAAGSGIPHVEAVLNAELPQAPYRIVRSSSSAAFWRSAPVLRSVAKARACRCRRPSATHRKVFRRDWPDCRALLAAGAGAGLATAFNAPLAGGIFVLEELVRRFEVRGAITALGASATAISVSRVILATRRTSMSRRWSRRPPRRGRCSLCLGRSPGSPRSGITCCCCERWRCLTDDGLARRSACGAGGRAGRDARLVRPRSHRRRRSDHATRPARRRCVRPASACFPVQAGAGRDILFGGNARRPVCAYARFGAQLGLFFGQACQLAFPGLQIQPEGFAIVGMAAFFTGVVRAPLTGLVLVTEMTADVTMLLPMLGACAMAMLTPTLLRNPPIYDSLRERTIERAKARRGL